VGRNSRHFNRFVLFYFDTSRIRKPADRKKYFVPKIHRTPVLLDTKNLKKNKNRLRESILTRRRYGKIIDHKRILEFSDAPEKVVAGSHYHFPGAAGGAHHFYGKLGGRALYLHAVLIDV